MSLIDKVQETRPIFTNTISIENRTHLKFRKKYYKKLFLEPDELPVLLSETYVEPDVSLLRQPNKEKSIIYLNSLKYIKDYLSDNKNKVLIIEGKAGVGKSSLLARFAADSNGEKEYYISLKDFLKYEKINLKEVIFTTFSISQDATNLVFFLDGLDEIYERVDKLQLADDFLSLIEADCYVICTVRPGYVDYDKLLTDVIQKVVLEPFDKTKREMWIDKYQLKKPNLDEKVRHSLICTNSYINIISIPIILYIIASKNINIENIKSIPQLYETLFIKLKDDKSSYTKMSINKHYDIAQQLGFYMECEHILSVNRCYVENTLHADSSFYSSVYMETILEGEEYIEFVHKSIQEFFAAKYIIKSFSESETKNISTFCGKRKISDEVLYNIKYLLNETSKQMIYKRISGYIEAGFPYSGISEISVKKYNELIDNTFWNIHAIFKQLNMRKLRIMCVDQDAIYAYFFLAARVKVYEATKYITVKELFFLSDLFFDIDIKHFEFYNTVFESNKYNNCCFENCSFYQCSFIFGLDSNKIIYKACNFVMPVFDCSDKHLYTELDTVRFINCTFVFYERAKKEELETTAFTLNKCSLDIQSHEHLSKYTKYFVNID